VLTAKASTRQTATTVLSENIDLILIGTARKLRSSEK